MTASDEIIVCTDCGASFPFTAMEAAFYAEKQLASPPKRCKSCRAARKERGGPARGPGNRGQWSASRAPTTPRAHGTMFDVVCGTCGGAARVPFRPVDGREVFCQPCYRARKPR
jgi:CxxC-x17-CxxC domain-containing protein